MSIIFTKFYINLKVLISFSIILIYRPQCSHCSIMNVWSQRMQEACEITGCEILCLLLVELLYTCSRRDNVCTSIEWCNTSVVSLVAQPSSTVSMFSQLTNWFSVTKQGIIIHVWLSHNWHLPFSVYCATGDVPIHFVLSAVEIFWSCLCWMPLYNDTWNG
jgi:hypothetical protein